MKQVDLMIFDLDGTLADTGEDLAASVNHTLKALDMETRSYDEIIGFVGDGIRKLIERALGERSIADVDKTFEVFSRHYEKHLLDSTVLYPNVEGVLKRFSHIKKVVLTNKRYYLALDIARGLGIEKYFIEIVGADSTPFIKPDSRVVDYLLSKYGVAKDSAVMIGDGVNDIAVAKHAGILSCACLNGLGKRDALLAMGADYYCEHLMDISDWFQ